MKITLAILLAIACLSMATAQENQPTCPCCKETYRQFDFWLGNWEAFSPDNKLAGRNNIVLLQDSCILQENWVSASPGYTGTSYNFYNPQTGKWHQTWIDNQGASLLLTGTFENGSMVLWSETMKTQKGEPYRNRITWTPNTDGTVRQHWEMTTDEGKTWTTLFDGLYKKIKTK